MQSIEHQVLPATAEEHSEGVDSDHFSGSTSSFLANEKLLSVDSINSDITGIIPAKLNYLIGFHSRLFKKIFMLAF